MKKTWWRILAMALATIMMIGALAACDGGSEEPADPDAPKTETGTEAELTAVRDELIKATETKDITEEITAMEFYENGVRTTSDKYVQAKDNKKMYYFGNVKRVVNYTDGYIIDMPQDWKPDYSLSSLRCRYVSDDVTMIASNETEAAKRYSEGFQQYLDTVYLYLKNEDFQKNNKITVIEAEKKMIVDDDWTAEIYRVKLEGCKEGMKCYYTYVDFYNEVGKTVHMMFKAVDDRSFEDVIGSFKYIILKGAPIDTQTYPCEPSETWSAETLEKYETICSQDVVDWGLFASKLETTGWDITIPQMEKRIDYKFPVISQYVHFGSKDKNVVTPGKFPTEFANKVDADGRMMQITYQYTINNNMDMTEVSPMLDIYRGKEDALETLTDFAKDAAAYGKPFYFRLNNEMNTDWTSYCGLANMLDPEIFQDTWVTLYDIFTETGANQYAMWVFNGFDGSYPPFNWCNYRCYMPDAKYIQLIGLTGYNGDAKEGEATNNWRTFPQIYDDICTGVTKNYNEYFSEWPWIISEFGCEGLIPEDRAEWVTEMFQAIADGNYPNIKVAVWFSANDFNAETGEVTNKFTLDGDTETLKAFKEGLALTQ
ncbi:MAG: hypothetical protein IJU16_04700 [Clostridia bacterium]|nr:hypothetical protein [Clostridia bacterium]